MFTTMGHLFATGASDFAPPLPPSDFTSAPAHGRPSRGSCMHNAFETRSTSLSGPGIGYSPVTPDDGADLPTVAISLFVETGGAVTFVSQKG